MEQAWVSRLEDGGEVFVGAHLEEAREGSHVVAVEGGGVEGEGVGVEGHEVVLVAESASHLGLALEEAVVGDGDVARGGVEVEASSLLVESGGGEGDLREGVAGYAESRGAGNVEGRACVRAPDAMEGVICD